MAIQIHGTVLVVAGSDPSAGAGLQADLKTVVAMGGHAMTAVTAVTVQDTLSVHHVYPLPSPWVAQQMRACLQDVPVDCIKLGMLATQESVLAVAEVLAEWPEIPVVADPVLAGTGGGTLLNEGGRRAFLSRLMPHLSLVTPNLPEAEALSGMAVRTVADMEQAARHLASLTPEGPAKAPAVLVTGGHLPGTEITEVLFHRGRVRRFHTQRISGPGFHGTGCVLASAIAMGLARGETLEDAVCRGLEVVRHAMEEGFTPGKGQRLLQVPVSHPTLAVSSMPASPRVQSA